MIGSSTQVDAALSELARDEPPGLRVKQGLVETQSLDIAYHSTR